MLLKKLIIGLLSFYVVEVKKSSNRNLTAFPDFHIERVYEEKKKKLKIREKTYENKKWKKKSKYKNHTLKWQGSHPKGVRFSNQKSLRRMYRNT
jgi:hypothetical protein